jgi:hypothetical protein
MGRLISQACNSDASRFLTTKTRFPNGLYPTKSGVHILPIGDVQDMYG